ncbi:CheR family methyltransferase [Bosea psychrotolerans]|uniref:Chemotaxis protein methyltransferase n=1 Tax=Bosea psychrotolerans TaxID=1871628 RepID=A0A2S4LUX4_9HYPH|nr:protein-glutamate O-methyltransferase [Bosea psychrotolerans]POR46149.1 CheR-type MCP methyltransferase [Bosea psychrotolerans]
MKQPHPEAFDRLNDRHFAAIAEVIETRVGIKLPQTKRTMVEGRLRKRLRALGLANLTAYGDLLFKKNGLDAELVNLIDCVTTNKTDFFREPSHFEFLRDVAVPQLARQRGERPLNLKIWSAACSTGAEAYTMAMVLQDLVNAGKPLRFSILGTDISTEVLRDARTAIYPREFVAPVPAAMQQRYLMRAKNPREDVVRIAPELRRTVNFERLNLMDESYPFDRDVDVIFCRNVLIYFDKPTQQAVIARLVSHLRPGGYLMLGHSESMAGSGVPGLQSVAPTTYQVAQAVARRIAA